MFHFVVVQLCCCTNYENFPNAPHDQWRLLHHQVVADWSPAVNVYVCACERCRCGCSSCSAPSGPDRAAPPVAPRAVQGCVTRRWSWFFFFSHVSFHLAAPGEGTIINSINSHSDSLLRRGIGNWSQRETRHCCVRIEGLFSCLKKH